MMDRRNLLGGLMALAGAAANVDATGSEPWPDRVFNLKSAKTTQAPFGETTIYFEGPTGQLSSMVAGSVLLHPGQEPHPPHRHPEEEFMLVTEGSGEFLVHDKKSRMGPGTLLYCEGNHEHGVKNTGETPLRFYFFKWSVGNRS